MARQEKQAGDQKQNECTAPLIVGSFQSVQQAVIRTEIRLRNQQRQELFHAHRWTF